MGLVSARPIDVQTSSLVIKYYIHVSGYSRMRNSQTTITLRNHDRWYLCTLKFINYATDAQGDHDIRASIILQCFTMHIE